MWVNSPRGVPAQVLIDFARGYRVVYVMIASGHIALYGDVLPTWIAKMRAAGFEVAGWAWATGQRAEDEGRLHAQVAQRLGLRLFVANAEKAFDGTQDSGWSPTHFAHSTEYLRGLRSVSELIQIGVSPEPRSDMDHAAWQRAGAVVMPQAYPLENGHNVTATVAFHLSRGWPKDRIVPLAGIHPTNGRRYSAAEFSRQARTAGVPVVLYPADAALDVPDIWPILAAT